MRLAPILLLIVANAANAANAEEFESRYYKSVFSGDLSWTLTAAPKTASGIALKTKFNEQFLLGAEGSEIAGIEDPLVRAIVRRYQGYWREALLAPSAIESAERRHATDIARLIALDGITVGTNSLDEALALLLKRRGFGYRGGRTEPLLDLMIWRATRTEQFAVELTDTRQTVVVHFLTDFVIRGWSHFATFGRSGTGGWADRDALFCIADAYDLESEQFRNSYLRHEARHFADYRRYPELQGADLEYRGKLTELAFSKDALRLAQKFRRHSNPSSTAPHPLANWHVVQDMAETANSMCDEDAMQCLETVSNEDLQSAARHLIAGHSNRLRSLGADTVKTTIEPAPSE